MRTRTLVLAALTLLVATAAPGKPPEVFEDLPFDRALERAEAEGKMLLVFAAAEDNSESVRMERVTWGDEVVVEYVREHAIAIRFDHNKEAALAARVDARFPCTTIVYRQGVRFDYHYSYLEPDDFRRLLGLWASGRSKLNLALLNVGFDERERSIAYSDKFENTQRLFEAGRHEAATESLVWLWRNLPPPLVNDFTFDFGVDERIDMLADDTKRALETHATAREKFVAVRDGFEQALREGEDASYRMLESWIALNGVLGDTDRTIEWHDRVANTEAGRRAIRRLAHRLIEPLRERERWSDLGKVYERPTRAARRQFEMFDWQRAMDRRAGRAHEDLMMRFSIEQVGEDVGVVYGACLATGREQDAQAVADVFFESECNTARGRRALVEAALRMNQPRPVQRDWLEGDDSREGKDLRRRLEDALRALPQ